jgi:zinc protease
VLEDDDQQGLAHFVEHMEFEGTTHFPRKSIDDFLSSLGLSIGPDANAETSFDDTQYILRVPTDAPGALDRALLVLQDWAGAATFDQAGIDSERNIVLSEWRLHLGADERTSDAIREVQLEGSRYAVRSPIGKPDNIQNATRDQLVRFYHDWYRPNLMAVIVVGEIDRDAVVQMIKDHFSPITSPQPERPRPNYTIADRPATRYAILKDKETTQTAVMMSDLRPARNQGSVGGYRDIMKDGLFANMLSDRLDELAQGANPPFLRAQAGRDLFQTNRSKDEAVMQALVPSTSDGVTKGLDALVTELQRVARFGFTSTELDRAKVAIMANSERVTAESPDRESESRADEYTRNFLEDEALPTIWQELAFHRRLVPGITLTEINALANDWFPEQNRLVIVAAPDLASVKLPAEAQLAAAVRTASAKHLEAYVDATAGQALMDKTPARGSITKTTEHPEAGITEWTLSNGATVVLKPTKLREDQILFRAFAPGGESLAGDADLVPAKVADLVVPAGGAGKFSDVALDRMTTGKAVAVSPFIDEISEGMGGGAAPQDLETMFQLLYLRFTQPREDPNAFASLAGQARASLANQDASPDVVFGQTIDSALSQNSPRRRPDTPATIDQWNLQKSMAFYKARFADAGNFTFVFVGSFTIDAIRPLIETYVASLPATHAHETWKDVGIRPPAGIVQRTVRKGIAPKSEVTLVFTGPMEYDDAHVLALRTVTLLLQSRLLDTIRQELGATYSITATPSAHKSPSPQYEVRVDWTCDPARVDDLVRRVFEEIQYVKDTNLGAGQMTLVRQSLTRDYERSSQDNAYLLNQVSRRYQDGDTSNLAAVDSMSAEIAALTGEQVGAAARTYLNTGSYVEAVLMPETR